MYDISQGKLNIASLCNRKTAHGDQLLYAFEQTCNRDLSFEVMLCFRNMSVFLAIRTYA